NIQFHTTYNNFNYGYDKVTFIDNTLITNRLLGSVLSIGGAYSKNIKKFNMEGDFGLNVSGDFTGNYIMGGASYQLTDDLAINAKISHNSKAPNYNYLMYQSVYENYNWQTNFNNIKTQNLEFALSAKKIANISVDITTIND